MGLGVIKFDQPLPLDLNGKTIQVTIEEISQPSRKRRQSGSAKGQLWMSPDVECSGKDENYNQESS